MYLFSCFLVATLLAFCKRVSAEECGTRFTDFTSNVVLAEVVLQGSVMEFNPPSSGRLRSANISMVNVYKGMDVLKSSGGFDGRGRNVMIQSFGTENKENCVASDTETFKGQEMVFFLRQSPDRKMMEHSALPHPAEGNEKQRVKRSLCDTCIRPPTIRRLVCKDCAKQPHIKSMKSKKANMGRRARLRCISRGKPAPKLSWFKNQVPVMSGNGGVTIRNTALTSTLIFMKTTSAHSGQYTCKATNEVGETEEVVTLEVVRKTGKKRKESRPTNISVKNAPDKIQCEANPCINGGTCFFSPTLNLRQCVCASGFEGVRCENVLSSGAIQGSDSEQISPATGNSSNVHIKPPMKPTQTEKEETRTVFTTQTVFHNNLDTTTTNNQPRENRRPPQTPNQVPKPIKPQTPSNNNILPPTIDRSRSPLLPSTNSRPTSRFGSNGQVLAHYPVKKKSSLKIIPCREKNFCLNKGKCRYISKLRKKFCQCRKGYTGPKCERVLF